MIFLYACTEPGVGGQNAGTEQQANEELPETDPIHPDFGLDAAQFSALLERAASVEPRALTPGIRREILSRPQVFLDLYARILAMPEEIFVRADKERAVGPDLVPQDLVSLNRYGQFSSGHPFLTLNRNDLSLRTAVLPDLFAMIQAARQAGVSLDISSSYRSYEYQLALFQRWVDELGLEEAERVSARAGTSQHQLGTTMDFGSVTLEFAASAAGRWLSSHASEYGFSLSYPNGFEWLTGYSYEPWHYRWLGRDALRLQEEFFEGSQFRFLLFVEATRGAFR